MEEGNKRIVDISTLAYDLNTITDFIFQNKNKDKSNEIKEFYETTSEGLKLVQKTISEIKNEEMSSVASIRYDLVRMLIDKANSIIMDDYSDADEPIIEDSMITSPLLSTLGDTFAINTLLREGMLVNMDLKELDNENGK